MTPFIPHRDYTLRLVLLDDELIARIAQTQKVTAASEPATVEDAVQVAYGTSDLGTHVIMSGGEPLETGPQTGHDEIPI